ncbi:lipid-A-disaccharide synthase [Aliiglaciecola sp. 3_MG-2023]|uniref:lipid-A-disaccharide synthase n=1 Tax=Aliiglaciecola sp. 3_MG-2023 TaxID=3062644 RepID=UPI0026E270E6|nr:lipid-A-disaccharide synthase [Aliiglaciecola sp. 3_MG-2023]MDO6694073.1 lipid-A-disaccharide synthase [Aliiglaciecola sp. 3_MG-2023]
MSERPLKIAIVAGEASGDVLAAGMIKQILAIHPDAQFTGIAGPNMLEQGCKTLFDMEELSVMGIVEVLSRIRRLLFIRKSVLQHFTEDPPDVFIGVDAPDFNLPLEKKLKKLGIKTVHYVSPTVWAWRENRIFGIAEATNLVLSIFPFEKAVYDKHGFPCQFVGHTMADDIALYPDQALARQQLDGVELSENAKVLALLPGSRGGEVSMLLEIFLLSASKVCATVDDLHVIIPAVNESRKNQIEAIVATFKDSPKYPKNMHISVVMRQSRNVMIAADGILLASGTASLEAMLCKRPMVVAYRLKWLTHQIMKVMYKPNYFSLPNVLADKPIVPELLQEEVNPETISKYLIPMFSGDSLKVPEEFVGLHKMLKQDADKQAAAAVLKLIGAQYE